MTSKNGDFGYKLAAMSGDTFADSLQDDVIHCAYDGPSSRVFRIGFSTTGLVNATQSVVSVGSNGLVCGLLCCSNLSIGTSSVSNTLITAGNASFQNKVITSGFSNCGGGAFTFMSNLSSTITYTQTMSNMSNAFVGGVVNVTSNLTVRGMMTVNDVMYVTNNVSLVSTETIVNRFTVSGYISNSLNVVCAGASNIGGASYFSTLSNSCNISVGGLLSLSVGMFGPSISNVGGSTYTLNVSASSVILQGNSNSNCLNVSGSANVAGILVVGGACNLTSSLITSNLYASNIISQTLCNVGNAYFTSNLFLNGLNGVGFSNNVGTTYSFNLNCINCTTSSNSYTSNLFILNNLATLGGINGPAFSNTIIGNTYVSLLNTSNLLTQTVCNIGNVYTSGLASFTSGFGTIGLSNITGNTYVSSLACTSLSSSNLLNNGSILINGSLNMMGGVSGGSFSNVAGSTFCSNMSVLNANYSILSNMGNAYAGGVTVGSNMIVSGTLSINNFEAVTSNLTCIANEYITSNLTIAGDVNVTGRILGVQMSNIGNTLYTTAHSNSGNSSSGGLLQLITGVNLAGSNVVDSNANGQFSALTTPSVSVGTVVAGNMNYFRNRVVNGDMRVDQRYLGLSHSGGYGSTYVADRVAFFTNTGTSMLLQQLPLTYGSSIYANLAAIGGARFTQCIMVKVSVANATPGSSDRSLLYQRCEGLNLADLGWGTVNASPVVFSFYFQSSIIGTFSAAIASNFSNVSATGSFTVGVVNVWQRVQLTFPGNTSGVWAISNSSMFSLFITLQSGTSVSISPSSNSSFSGIWQSGVFSGVTSNVNFTATLNNVIYVTGIQLEKGTMLTPFEFRPYHIELQMCQRFFYQLISTTANQKLFSGFGALNSSNVGVFYTSVQFPTVMCRTPDNPPNTNLTGTTLSANGFGVGVNMSPTGNLIFDLSDVRPTGASIQAYYTNNTSNFFGFMTATTAGQYIQWSAEI